MPTDSFDRNTYLLGLGASTVYIFVLGYLATRQYVCDSVVGLQCPDSPFTWLHLLMHTGFFVFLLTFLGKIPQQLRWKWILLCLTAFSFMGLILLQFSHEVHSVIIYTGLLLSIVSFVILFQEKQVSGNSNKTVKIVLGALVMLGIFIFIRIASTV